MVDAAHISDSSRVLVRDGVLVRGWLWSVAMLVALMVVVGGATRLTDSGLSITEWAPIRGILPPLGAAEWAQAFDSYRATTEYQLVNRGMTLSEFQFIYWWEWGHRAFGRLIGLVFAVPLLGFWIAGRLSAAIKPRLLLLLALGALQGVVGWWMVKSGLTERVDVSQYRLAVHLTLACLIFAAIVWVAEGTVSRRGCPKQALRASGAGVLALVVLQIFAGGLVAGLDAGLAYNSWPLMDGAIVPAGLLAMEPIWLNAFENAKAVQFDHRIIAYALAVAVLLHVLAVSRSRPDRPVARTAALLFGATSLQIVLGIAALVAAVPIWLGLMHQAGALLVLLSATLHLRMLQPNEAYAARSAA